MKLDWRKTTGIASLVCAAMLAGCGAPSEDAAATNPSANAPPAGEDGTVLGTSWEALSYPNCVSATSDPDGDGWGWEFNRSCVVTAASTGAPVYPTCSSAAVDPDGDGWGWEFNRSCLVLANAASSGASATPAPRPAAMNCANPEGTASTMAALVVAAATELKRWQPTKDFAIGRIGSDEALVLTAAAKARCADGVCANIQALLDFQKNEANGQVEFPSNVVLNAPALRSRLVAKFRDQKTCESQPSNGGTTNCPVEEHTLIFQRSEKGGCDTNFFFVAKKPDGQPLQFPGQLKNKLLWADRTNPYIGFQNVGEVVSVDPTFGLNDSGSTSTGSCTAACVKLSATSAAGQCCSCNGETSSFVRSAWSGTTFLCR